MSKNIDIIIKHKLNIVIFQDLLNLCFFKHCCSKKNNDFNTLKQGLKALFF